MRTTPCTPNALLRLSIFILPMVIVLALPLSQATGASIGKASTAIQTTTGAGTITDDHEDVSNAPSSTRIDPLGGFGLARATASGNSVPSPSVEGEVSIKLDSAPPPGTFITGTAEVFMGQEWVATGVLPWQNVIFDVVLNVTGSIDVGQAGFNTDLDVVIGAGEWMEDGGSPDGYYYFGDWANFVCSTGNLGPSCYLDDVDASGLVVSINNLRVDLSGQVVLPNMSATVDPNLIVRTGPRLQLFAFDDLSTFTGFIDPAVADFIGTITIELIPQDSGVTLTPAATSVPLLGRGTWVGLAMLIMFCGVLTLVVWRPTRTVH